MLTDEKSTVRRYDLHEIARVESEVRYVLAMLDIDDRKAAARAAIAAEAAAEQAPILAQIAAIKEHIRRGCPDECTIEHPLPPEGR
jgi:hypothetical protein